MAKLKVEYVCSSCGFSSPKWMGKCPDCGKWSTLVEEVGTPEPKYRVANGEFPPSKPVRLADAAEIASRRTVTGIAEFDRVMGGGVVPSSATLVGGDPGIGKSTILLQVARGLSRDGGTVLYVSGEESEGQVKLRASRLGIAGDGIYILSETSVERVMAAAADLSPSALIVDSIQTMFTSDLPGAPGSVGQVRDCAGRLVFYGKKAGISLFLVGHVTKEGAIAGPRVLEHIVDTVLYFEGEKGHPYRILKAVKNRFGSTNEIGVFEMRATGLAEVADPSGLFLSERGGETSGTLVFPAIEGTRPLLVEVQALTSQSFLAMPRRTTIGADSNRVVLLCAILEKKAGFSLYNQDVFVNVAGGVSLDEPAADLPLLCAVAASFKDLVVPPGTAVFGEVGLGGEVRAVPMAEPRISESARMGFTRVILPASNAERLSSSLPLSLVPVRHVKEALSRLKGEGRSKT
jgi:DNA repair protein RadA/Sms